MHKWALACCYFLRIPCDHSTCLFVTIKETGWKVVGYASRLDLPRTFIDFCGGSAIFRVEKTPLNFDNVKSMVRRGERN